MYTSFKDVKRMWQSLHEDVLQNDAYMELFLKGTVHLRKK